MFRRTIRLRTVKPWVTVLPNGENVHANQGDITDVPLALARQRIANLDAEPTDEPCITNPVKYQMLECPSRCGVKNSEYAARCENPRCGRPLR
jgi:hypothetical protein